jgi:hypothetical protein
MRKFLTGKNLHEKLGGKRMIQEIVRGHMAERFFPFQVTHIGDKL